MGYTTDFSGSFCFDKTLKPEHKKYLNQFSDTRRMKRDVKIAAKFPDPTRIAVGLGLGIEGEYFVGNTEDSGQTHDESIIEYNREPSTQPGLWCQWVVNEAGTALEWNGAEKFYNYTEWLLYIIKNFLIPWGYKLTGIVVWQGEDSSDKGKIIVKDNEVQTVSM